MAEQYNFTHEAGPVIPVSLFGEAASAGINAGNALPTPLTAGIQGAVKGYQTGQEIAKTTGEIEGQDTINQINQLKLKIAKETEAQQLEVTKQELISKAQELQKQNETMSNQREIASRLASPDLYTKKSILDDPKLLGTIYSDTNYANQVIGQLTPYMTEDEKKSAFQRFDFAKAQEQKFQLDKVAEANKKTLDNQLAQTIVDINKDGQLKYLMNSNNLNNINAFAAKTMTYPAGVKSVNPVTGEIDTSQADKDNSLIPGSSGRYDVFVNGKKSPITIDETSNARLQTIQQILKQNGLLPPEPTPQATQAPQASTTRPFSSQFQAASGPVTQGAVTPIPTPSGEPIPQGAQSTSDLSNPIVAQRANDLVARAQNDPDLMNRLVAKGLVKSAPQTPTPNANVNPVVPPSPLKVPTSTETNPGVAAPTEASPTAEPASLKQVVDNAHSVLPASSKRYVEKGVMTKVLNEPLLKGLGPLYQAVAAVESGGISKAKSPTGPKGFFQLSEAAAKDAKVNRNVPSQNVKGGVAYLNQLLARYGGNEIPALMAYNVGMGPIDQAIDLTNSASLEDLLFGLQYLKSKGFYSKLLTDSKLQETAKYPFKVLAYKEAFQNLSYV